MSTSNDIQILTEGQLFIKDSFVLSQQNSRIILNSNAVEVSGNTILGSMSYFSVPDIHIIAMKAELDSYISGNKISFDIYGENLLLKNEGVVLGKSVDGSNIQGSFENYGLIQADNGNFLVQGSKSGHFTNEGTLKGENLTTVINGKVDINKGKRIAAQTLLEVFPEEFHLSEGTGLIDAQKIRTYTNLNTEDAYSYFNRINSSEIKTSFLNLFDTSLDKEKVVQLNKSILLDAGIDITTSNLEVLEDVLIKTKGKLALTARFGNLTLKQATRLQSDDQVVLFAKNTIARLAVLKGEGSSAEAQVSEIDAGMGGIEFHSGNYFDQGGITTTEGTIVADVAGTIRLLPLLLEHKEERKKHELFGDKKTVTGFAKFFGTHWEAQSVEGLDKAQYLNAINFRVNNKPFNRSEFNTGKNQFETIEQYDDVYYSYTEYSANLAAYIVRGAAFAIASFYGGPLAGAAAATVTEPLVTGKDLTLDGAIRSFSINYAAAYVSAQVAPEYAALAGALTYDAGQIILNGRSYTIEDFLTSVATGAIADGIFSDPNFKTQFLLVQKLVENLTYNAISSLIHDHSLELNSEFMESSLKSALNQSVEILASQYTTAFLKNYHAKIEKEVALKQQKKEIIYNTSSLLDEAQQPGFSNTELQQGIAEFNNLPNEKKAAVIKLVGENIESIAEVGARDLFGKELDQLTTSERSSDEFHKYVHNKMYEKAISNSVFPPHALADAAIDLNTIKNVYEAAKGPMLSIIQGGASAGLGGAAGLAATDLAGTSMGAFLLTTPAGWATIGAVVVIAGGGYLAYDYYENRFEKRVSETKGSAVSIAAGPNIDIQKGAIATLIKYPEFKDSEFQPIATTKDNFVLAPAVANSGNPVIDKNKPNNIELALPQDRGPPSRVYTYKPEKTPTFILAPRDFVENQTINNSNPQKKQNDEVRYIYAFPEKFPTIQKHSFPDYVEKFKREIQLQLGSANQIFNDLKIANDNLQEVTIEANDIQPPILLPPINPDDQVAESLYQAARAGEPESLERYRLHQANQWVSAIVDTGGQNDKGFTTKTEDGAQSDQKELIVKGRGTEDESREKLNGFLKSLNAADPAVAQIEIIFSGGSKDVAIIGRSMLFVESFAKNLNEKTGINTYVFNDQYLKVKNPGALEDWKNLVEKRLAEGKRVPDFEVITTDIYKENMNWIKEQMEKGRTIINIGNPAGLENSAFWEGEKNLIKNGLSK